MFNYFQVKRNGVWNVQSRLQLDGKIGFHLKFLLNAKL